MGMYDDMIFPSGYSPGVDPGVGDRIEDKRMELERLQEQSVRARALINSDHWKVLVGGWQERIRGIVGQFNPTSPTALSDAVFGMGMLRQIYMDMDSPQEIINRYEKKKSTYDKLVRSQRPK